MKKNQLTQEQKEQLLEKSLVASIAMCREDGSPYVLPLHFVIKGNVLYFHSRAAGEKLDNIQNNEQVCVLVYDMKKIIDPATGEPCNTNTSYESVMIFGKATLVQEFAEKEMALNAVVEKYTPQLIGKKLPKKSIEETAVVRVQMDEVFGKFYS